MSSRPPVLQSSSVLRTSVSEERSPPTTSISSAGSPPAVFSGNEKRQAAGSTADLVSQRYHSTPHSAARYPPSVPPSQKVTHDGYSSCRDVRQGDAGAHRPTLMNPGHALSGVDFILRRLFHGTPSKKPFGIDPRGRDARKEARASSPTGARASRVSRRRLEVAFPASNRRAPATGWFPGNFG